MCFLTYYSSHQKSKLPRFEGGFSRANIAHAAETLRRLECRGPGLLRYRGTVQIWNRPSQYGSAPTRSGRF